jgi:integrase
LLEYFSSLLKTHSWSTVKLDLYGLKFFYRHVLHKPWENVDLIKPPKAVRLPDIVTIDEAARLFQATNKLSYRVFYFTVYSLGLRLGEGLRLEVGDIDAGHQRIHIRDAKGNKDSFLLLQNLHTPHPCAKSHSKHLIQLLQLILKINPTRGLKTLKQRPQMICACCGAKMKIIKTMLEPIFTIHQALPT